MLNVNFLKDQFKEGIHNIVIPAINEIIKIQFPYQSTSNNELAKQMADTFDDLVSDSLADIFANAIDCYIKNISITGNLVTTGNAQIQTVTIESSKTPLLNGKIPNTLGIS